MTNEEAIEFGNMWLEVNEDCKDSDTYAFFQMAIKALEQEPETEWIPVSERLPEEKGCYLVSVKNEHDRRYSKTCWFHGDGNWFARQDVEFWMPLPEPYKAESEVKENGAY